MTAAYPRDDQRLSLVSCLAAAAGRRAGFRGKHERAGDRPPPSQLHRLQLAVAQPYCIIVREQIIASKGYGERARDFVNFRKFSPCIARARRACVGLTVYPPMRDFGSLILGKYRTFVCGSLFREIKLIRDPKSHNLLSNNGTVMRGRASDL